MTEYVAAVVSYPSPNPPEIFLIPVDKITDELHEILVENAGSEIPAELSDQLVQVGVPWGMSPKADRDNGFRRNDTVHRWYGFTCA